MKIFILNKQIFNFKCMAQFSASQLQNMTLLFAPLMDGSLLSRIVSVFNSTFVV